MDVTQKSFFTNMDASIWRRVLSLLTVGLLLASCDSFDEGSRATSGSDGLSQNARTPMLQGAEAKGPTYYVATDGSDSDGDGSASSPWATITYATDQAVDGSTVLVRPGRYEGRQLLNGRYEEGLIVRSEVPYQAQLRNDGRVLTCFTCEGVTVEGFDIAHTGPGSGGLVIQIQDGLGEANGPSDGEVVSDLTLRNNVLHDSYNNDIVKIGNGVVDITVEGNVFYNQNGTDEHLDLNSVADVVVQDNIFFNDFAGSGRTNDQSTTSFIVIKDSNGDDDDFVGNEDNTVRRNIFLNYEGRNDGNFVQVGGDNVTYFSAYDILIENNLLLGNGEDVIRSPFGLLGVRDVTVRFNTVVGDLPTRAYGLRAAAGGNRPANENLSFYGNVWSDPTGTMASLDLGYTSDRFTASPPEETVSFALNSNLYWNGGEDIPESDSELINYTDDPNRVIGDPLLPVQESVQVPRWNPEADQFADGSSTIREAFERLVRQYGIPGGDSATIEAGNPKIARYVPKRDILGRVRTGKGHADLGAYAAGSRAAN